MLGGSMSADEVIRQLVIYKSIIVAGLFGNELLKTWAEGTDMPEETRALLKTFETEFLACLKSIDATKKLRGEHSVKNQFYLAFTGVPLSDVEADRRLKRIDSGAPQPCLMQMASHVELNLKPFKAKTAKTYAAAQLKMQTLLRKHPVFVSSM